MSSPSFYNSLLIGRQTQTSAFFRCAENNTRRRSVVPVEVYFQLFCCAPLYLAGFPAILLYFVVRASPYRQSSGYAREFTNACRPCSKALFGQLLVGAISAPVRSPSPQRHHSEKLSTAFRNFYAYHPSQPEITVFRRDTQIIDVGGLSKIGIGRILFLGAFRSRSESCCTRSAIPPS